MGLAWYSSFKWYSWLWLFPRPEWMLGILGRFFFAASPTIRKAYPTSLQQLKKWWRNTPNISFITDSLFCNSNQRFKSNSNTAKTEKYLEPTIQESRKPRNSVFLLLQRTLKANALCCADEEEESLYPLISISPVAHPPCSQLHEREGQTLPLCSPRLSPPRNTQDCGIVPVRMCHYFFLPLWNHVRTSLSITH